MTRAGANADGAFRHRRAHHSTRSSHRYGAKRVFLLNFVACVLCYGITAMSTSMTGLYISFLPTLFQHGVLAARAYISCTSPDKDIARRTGYVGLAYGLGFVVGPSLGGALTSWDLRAAAWIATAGSLLSVVLVAWLLPGGTEPKAGAERAQVAEDSDGKESGLLAKAVEAARVLASNPTVQFVLALKLLFGCAMALLYSAFSLYLTDTFDLSPAQYGGIMSFAGVVGMVSQAVLVKEAQANLDGFQVTAGCGLLLGVGLLGFAFSGTWMHVCLVMVPITVASTVLSNISSAQLVSAVEEGRGAIVAVDMGLGSAVRIVSPKAAKWLVATAGFPAVGMVAAGLTGGMVALAFSGASRLAALLSSTPAVADAPPSKGKAKAE